MKSPPQFQKASQVVPVFNGYSQLVLPLVLRLFFQQTSTSPTLECRHLFRLPRGHVSQMILMLSMPHRMRKIIKKYLSLSLSIYIYIYSVWPWWWPATPILANMLLEPTPMASHGVAEPSPRSKWRWLTTLIWPEGGFGHSRPADLGVTEPPPMPLAVVWLPPRVNPKILFYFGFFS
jgi:hypothetical protein